MSLSSLLAEHQVFLLPPERCERAKTACSCSFPKSLSHMSLTRICLRIPHPIIYYTVPGVFVIPRAPPHVPHVPRHHEVPNSTRSRVLPSVITIPHSSLCFLSRNAVTPRIMFLDVPVDISSPEHGNDVFVSERPKKFASYGTLVHSLHCVGSSCDRFFRQSIQFWSGDPLAVMATWKLPIGQTPRLGAIRHIGLLGKPQLQRTKWPDGATWRKKGCLVSRRSFVARGIT